MSRASILGALYQNCRRQELPTTAIMKAGKLSGQYHRRCAYPLWKHLAIIQPCTQARNLARLIWVLVALPPSDDTSGKTPATDITPLQLRRRKIDALKLIMSYVYSVKHYLREEDGLEWDDYVGVIPESFSRTYSRRQSRRSSISAGYNAVSEHVSSVANSRPASPGQSRGTSADGEPSPVATKRVRVKRSSDKVATARSPLIEGHSAIDFQGYNDASMPFPLMFVGRSLFTRSSF